VVHIVYISTHASVIVGLHHYWDVEEVRDLSPKNQKDHEHVGCARAPWSLAPGKCDGNWEA
jgi:hypothetical protein